MMDVCKTILFTLCLKAVASVLRDLTFCHDDFDLHPKDGLLKTNTFKWLAFVHYVHVTTEMPHLFKAPRVVLIHKQFVLATAADMLVLPKSYKLGNIIFGEYERDEDQCGLTLTQINMGRTCPRAYFEISHVHITPHPEYSRFRIGNSLALVKLRSPIKSSYMVPICLPSIVERMKKEKYKHVFIVDYINSVPLDIDAEKMAKKTVRMFTHRECSYHRQTRRLGKEGVTHMLCTSGCSVRSGVPIVIQDSMGQFQLIGLAASSAPCARRSMRKRLNPNPPVYIDVYPYVNWITNVISANVLPRSQSQNFMLAESGTGFDFGFGILNSYFKKDKPQKYGWRGRTFVSGNYCYKSKETQSRTAFFYHEKFSARANTNGSALTIFMHISAGFETTITCARLLIPNHKHTPIIDGVGGFNISVQMDTKWFPKSFYFTLGIYGKNATRRELRDRLAFGGSNHWVNK